MTYYAALVALFPNGSGKGATMTGPGDLDRGDEGRAERRRNPDRRRTYNRRQDDRETSPPYFEVFERIAVALETIASTLPRPDVTLPDVEARSIERR